MASTCLGCTVDNHLVEIDGRVLGVRRVCLEYLEWLTHSVNVQLTSPLMQVHSFHSLLLKYENAVGCG